MIQANINDRYAQLSQQEKAELIGIYTRAGYRDLASIIAHYNACGGKLYGDGGPSEDGKLDGLKNRIRQKAVDYYYNHTLKPAIKKQGINDVRLRLYDHISPYGYKDAQIRIENALATPPFNSSERKAEDDRIRFSDLRYRDDIWRTYLNVPDDKSHISGWNPDRVVESKYKPTIGGDREKYYTINRESRYYEPWSKQKEGLFGGGKDEELVNMVLTGEPELPYTADGAWPMRYGETRQSDILGRYFGDHAVSRGMDPQKGDYVSFYDLWDISPSEGNNRRGGPDESHGIGTPIPFYDRLYLDDYFGVNSRPQNPDEYYGGYITPTIITANKEAEGGRLFGDGGRNPNEIRPGESISEWRKRITKQNATPEISGGQIIPSVAAASPQTKKGRYLMEKAIRPGIGKISSSSAEQLINDFGDAVSGTPMIITDPDVAVSLAYAAENLPNPDAGIRETQYNNARQAYLDSRFPGNDLFSQIYRWWRRKAPHKPVIEGDSFSGMGADIVSLNNNVIRLTPESKQSNALVNEFVESKYPSVMTAAEYKSDPNRIIGDKYRFPVSNVNFFAGVEDGKFRIDTLDNFNDDTVIFPARNIKKDVPEIYGIRIDRIGDENYGGKVEGTGHGDKLVRFVEDRSIGGLGWDEQFRAYLRQNGIDEKKYEAALDNALSQDISEPNNLSDYSLRDKAQMDWNRNYAYPMQDIYAMDAFLSPGGYRLPIDPVGWEQTIQDFGNKETDELRRVRERNYPYVQYAKASTNFWDVISNKYPTSPFNRNPFEKNKKETKYGFVDKDGNLHPISEYNASVLDGKTVIGNPNGSIFIGRLQDISKPQLDSLNAYLKDNPSRILRTDLGSFNQYKLDSPSLETYLEQYYEHPEPDDPNVFVIGTTEPNTLWNTKASGGKIHIKPENRGKFTALKKRTGHSASWFKAHGTPAQKKMATFALNARKWKHADGGPLVINSQYLNNVQQPVINVGGTPTMKVNMPEATIETPMSFDLAPELYNMVPLMYDIPTVTVPFASGVNEQELNPVKDAARRIRSVENSKNNPNGGWNEKEQRWYPHKSYEGGADTIAYGIKLSNGTPEAKLALQQGYLTDEQAVHFTDSLAQTYYDAAKKVYDKKYGDGEWDKLSPESQSFLTDFSYNPGLGKFPKLMEGFHSGNIDMIRQNYKRYSNGKPLGRNKTLLEELERFGNGVSIFRKCGGKIKKDGGEIQKFDSFSSLF